MEPSFQQFRSQTTTEISNTNVAITYNSVELPIGIRHYFFLNEVSRLFLSAAFIVDVPMTALIDFEVYQDLDRIDSLDYFGLGVGFYYDRRNSLEIRYGTPRDILKNKYLFWNSDFNTLSVIFGFTLL